MIIVDFRVLVVTYLSYLSHHALHSALTYDTNCIAFVRPSVSIMS